MSRHSFPWRDCPEIRLEPLKLEPEGDAFARVNRRVFRAHYPDGTESASFVYDEVERRCLDAVVIVAHYVEDGVRRVFLRSAARPPVQSRRRLDDPLAEGNLWELPAGLVEPDEQAARRFRATAQRELFEEVGFDVEPAALVELGPSNFPAPGLIGERHHYFEAVVDPSRRIEPPLDGSALEHLGEVIEPPLAVALEWCARGRLDDAKTELGLRRLAERYA